jgi:hypothetical protein
MEKAKRNIATLEQEISRIEQLKDRGQISEELANRQIFITRVKIDRLREMYKIHI